MKTLKYFTNSAIRIKYKRSDKTAYKVERLEHMKYAVINNITHQIQSCWNNLDAALEVMSNLNSIAIPEHWNK